jgi:hypothetical protein
MKPRFGAVGRHGSRRTASRTPRSLSRASPAFSAQARSTDTSNADRSFSPANRASTGEATCALRHCPTCHVLKERPQRICRLQASPMAA